MGMLIASMVLTVALNHQVVIVSPCPVVNAATVQLTGDVVKVRSSLNTTHV
jgi:hypothetical protein